MRPRKLAGRRSRLCVQDRALRPDRKNNWPQTSSCLTCNPAVVVWLLREAGGRVRWRDLLRAGCGGARPVDEQSLVALLYESDAGARRMGLLFRPQPPQLDDRPQFGPVGARITDYGRDFTCSGRIQGRRACNGVARDCETTPGSKAPPMLASFVVECGDFCFGRRRTTTAFRSTGGHSVINAIGAVNGYSIRRFYE